MNVPFKVGQPRFLTKDEVLTLHRVSIDAYGGADGILNDGALDSSLAMPAHGFSASYAHEFPFGMAAAYGYHLAFNHAFRDGNKRTAFAAMVVFLRISGWDFAVPDSDAAALMYELIEQRRDKAWLASRLELMSKARPSFELRDFFLNFSLQPYIDHIQATVLGTPSEFGISVDEAAVFMPLLEALQSQYGNAIKNNDERMVHYFSGQVAILKAIFRYAEDMGYEW